MSHNKKVAFICVHNSCRSQIAEAIMNNYGKDYIFSYSAGTEIKTEINQDAVRLMKEIYGIDMEKTQKPKLITEIPEVDYVISMGCSVTCPVLPYKYEKLDWDLQDPTGKSDEEFKKIIEEIEEKVFELIEKID